MESGVSESNLFEESEVLNKLSITSDSTKKQELVIPIMESYTESFSSNSPKVIRWR